MKNRLIYQTVTLLVTATFLLSSPILSIETVTSEFLTIKEKGIKSTLYAEDFLLKNYSNTAIATDLEPDDVFALAIIFEEANRIYYESANKKYPINLIIVGEGNTAIKRMRMEKLLQEYYNIPSEVHIEVVEGIGTRDNIFPFDGHELFEKEILEQIPFPDTKGCQQALTALESWAEQSDNPFIIQLKPAQELLYLREDLANKTTVLFYGSFNIRKIIDDTAVISEVLPELSILPSISARLEGLISNFSNRFSKVAILETFGVLKEQSCVCDEYEWTHDIGKTIAQSNNKFINMFRTLSTNWNQYILNYVLEESEKISQNLINENNDSATFLRTIHAEIVQLQNEWSRSKFEELSSAINSHSQEIAGHLEGDALRSWHGLIRNLNLGKKVGCNDIQFTLSDILVAIALTENSKIFSAAPIQCNYSEYGFLVPKPDPNSNVLYYTAVDKEKFSEALLLYLKVN